MPSEPEGTLLDDVHSLDTLWYTWAILFACSCVLFSLLHRYAFNLQISHASDVTAAEGLHQQKASNNKEVVASSESDKNSRYSPLNCMLFASSTISTMNACICALASLLLLYPGYWEDRLYGSPVPVFYVTAISQAYFLIDLMFDVLIFYVHGLPRFRWDQLFHHGFILIYMFCVLLPKPLYAWFVTELAFSMEFSTLFLNATFFAKWYRFSDRTIFQTRLGFVATWFLVRVPASIGIVVWIVSYFDRINEEYPLSKMVAVLIIAALNAALQSIWTVLVTKKTYRALTGGRNGPKQKIDVQQEDQPRTNVLDLE